MNAITNIKYLLCFLDLLLHLSEFIMWSDLNCGSINNFGSKCAFIVLCLEPLVATFAIYYYGTSKIPEEYMKYIFYFYFIFFGYFILRTIFYKKKLCSLPSPKLKHLIWDYDPIFDGLPKSINNLYWILYFLSGFLFLTFKNTQEGIIYFVLFYSH